MVLTIDADDIPRSGMERFQLLCLAILLVKVLRIRGYVDYHGKRWKARHSSNISSRRSCSSNVDFGGDFVSMHMDLCSFEFAHSHFGELNGLTPVKQD